MITTFFHNVPKSVARNLIKGMIGSFNASAIAYTRSYLRQSEFERVGDKDEAPTIDDYNDTLTITMVDGTSFSATVDCTPDNQSNPIPPAGTGTTGGVLK